MMNNNNTPNINDLFENAHAEGWLSNASMAALNVLDIGAEIQAGLGVNVDDVMASEVVLVTIMPDDSGSIGFADNEKAVRDGHNAILDALQTCQQKESILVHNRYLNGKVLYPYCQLGQAVRMDAKNYNPEEGTPLYDQMVVLLGTVLAKAQEFSENGVPVRTVTLVVTDGADEHSQKATAKTVAHLVRDMLKAENHIIAAMGIDDGSTDFRRVFREMGIRDEWVLTPGNSAAEIRRSFQMFSQSAVQATGGAAGFSQTALGGFGN